MIRIEEPMNCLILERINRFVVKVLLDGKAQRAYINNTGNLLGYIVKDRRSFCIKPRSIRIL